MNLLFVHDIRVKRYQDKFYLPCALGNRYFDKFFDSSFSKVYLFSRVVNVHTDDLSGYELLDTEGLIVLDVCPESFRQLLTPARLANVVRLLSCIDLVVLSTPSVFGSVLGMLCITFNIPFCCEVAGDPNMFSHKRGGRLWTEFFGFVMKRLTFKSLGSTYVTNALKVRYPAKKMLVSSNVRILNVLPAKRFMREWKAGDAEFKICMVGAISERKGVDLLLSAVKSISVQRTVNIKLILVGEQFDRNWHELTRFLALEDSVYFAGAVSPQEVLEILDSSNIYVQPSRAEGVPRAAIEAMSRGLPVLGSDLPGFREILCPSAISKSIESLSDNIVRLALEASFYSKLAEHSVTTAERFQYCYLSELRREYYSAIKRDLEAV